MKAIWEKANKRSWEELFLDAFVTAVESERMRLSKYAPDDISMDREELRQILHQDLAIEVNRMSLSALSSQHFSEELASAMLAHDILRLGGHQLDLASYKQLTSNLIRAAIANVEVAILNKADGPGLATLHEIQDIRAIVLQNQAFLRKHFDSILGPLSTLTQKVQDLETVLPGNIATALLRAQDNSADKRHLLACEDYLHAMATLCNNFPYLSLERLFGRAKRPLREFYIPLRARSKSKQLLREEVELSVEVSIERALQKASKSEPGHILIFGDPGSGKSTLLRQIAQSAWDNPGRIGLDQPYLPMIVRLQSLAYAEGASIETRLLDALHKASELLLNVDPPVGFIETWPRLLNAKWIFLLDGLDEIPAEKRGTLLKWLGSMLENMSSEGHLVLIASRPNDDLNIDIEDLTTVYEILPFTRDQQEAFAKLWFGEQAEKFLGEINRLQATDLSGTPLLLAIAAAVFSTDNILPDRRANLYERFISIWLTEAERSRLTDPTFGESLDDKAHLIRLGLEHFALTMTVNPMRLSVEGLQNIASTYLQEILGVTKISATVKSKRFVEIIGNHSGVFAIRGNHYEWLHPTFREFLAASAIAREHQPSSNKALELINQWTEPNWRVVVLFLLSIWSEGGHNVTKLVENIISANTTQSRLFAGETLAEGIHLDQKLDEAIVNDLLQWVKDLTYFDDYDEVITVLGRLHGRSYVTSGLKGLAKNRSIEPRIRRSLAWALERLGQADESSEVWLDMTKDPITPPEIQVIAAEALGRLGHMQEANKTLIALMDNLRIITWIRVYAAEALGRLGHVQEAREALLAYLHVPDAESLHVRQQVMEALGRLNMIDEIIALTHKGHDAQIRQQAAEVLMRLGQPDEAIEAWLAIARTQGHEINVHLRVQAAEALEKLSRTDEAVEAWLAIAKDQSVPNGIRQQAAEALERLGQPEQAIEAWLAIAKDQYLPSGVRHLAADALERLGQAEEAIEALLVIARTQGHEINVHLRVRAAEALERLSRIEGAMHAWLAIAEDQSVSDMVRQQAAEALERLGQPEQAIQIWQAIAHTQRHGINIQLRVQAADALERLGQPEQAIQIWLAIAHDYHPHRFEVPGLSWDLINALESLGGINSLRSLAQDNNVNVLVRQLAIKKIEEFGQTEQAIEALLVIARTEGHERDVHLRVTAAEALEKLGQTKLAIEAWLTIAYAPLYTGDMSLRVRAAEALERLGEIELATKVCVSLARSIWGVPSGVRQQAAEALERFGNIDQAIEAWLAIARTDKNSLSRALAAMALERFGNIDQAIEVWLDLDTGNELMHLIAKQVLKRLKSRLE
jgi:tetratricopeptide (TPR) repeat protein